ncbi:MAG: hypothetical protein L3K03_08135 [Thermoplasmata archaeon]|nr:hypothetical protein [Thermoplasmata archaeon]
MGALDGLLAAAPFLAVVVLIVLVLIFLIGVFLIEQDQVGILTRRMLGRPMPQGQVVARKGEVGVQADTLVPGLYWRMPFVWKVAKSPIVTIPDDKVGTVEAIDRKPLPKGRVVGDEIECNQFQDANAFLMGNGHKGPQSAILRPGQYRINTRAFVVNVVDATYIGDSEIGVVSAQDGVPLPSSLQIAPPSAGAHSYFQNGQAFLDGKGYRGPQLETLQPGLYYVNPLLFEVRSFKTIDVPPGTVAVLRSNVGEELVRPRDRPTPVGTSERAIDSAPIHDASETLLPLTDDKGTRGIFRNPLAPGRYNLNPVAYTAYIVPTNAVMIDWADSTVPNAGDFKFGALGVTSKDGFPIAVEVRLVARIDAANAAFIIARFGSIQSLIQQIIHPVIDAEFRNNAGNKKALEFVQSRSDLQAEALSKAKESFKRYNVEAQNLLISQIRMPPELMATQTQKEIAMQQQAQYVQQAAAEQQRIAVQEMTARAALQSQVVTAELEVVINENQAKAAVKQAEGIRDSTKIKAEGEKEALLRVGEGQGGAAASVGSGQATAVKSVGLAQAEAYRAQTEVIGAERVALVRVVEAIRDGHIQITPETQITLGGPEGGSAGSLLTAYFAKLLADQSPSSSSRRAAASSDPKKGE